KRSKRNGSCNNDDRTPLSEVPAPDKAKLWDLLIQHLSAAGELQELLDHLLERTAASVHGVDMMKDLLEIGASANTRCSDGDSILHLAAGAGSWKAVRALLGHGADVNATDRDGWTALHLAAMNGDTRTVAPLVSAGADVDFRSSQDDISVLDVAACNGHVAVIEFLRLNGADARAGNSEGYTALHAAASAGEAGAIEELVRGGAADKRADINTQDGEGRTPLRVAITEERVASVTALCGFGADVNRRDGSGRTPFHLGIATDYVCFYTLGAFLDAGAHVNLRQLDDDLSPLDLASSGGHAVTMTRLLEHGARVNARDSEGETALLKAARNGQDSAVEVLIRAGADVNVPDSYGRTPLHFAAETLVMKSAEALLLCGARVNVRDSWGRSPLLRAASVSRDDSGAQMIDFLLRWGADESVGDVDGRIPVQVLGFYERQRAPNTPIDTYARHLLVNASAWRRRRVPVMSRA
ncbi:unnamed protein product, partial [Laminaria digitata]